MALAFWIVVAWLVLAYGLSFALHAITVLAHVVVWIVVGVSGVLAVLAMLVLDRRGLARAWQGLP